MTIWRSGPLSWRACRITEPAENDIARDNDGAGLSLGSLPDLVMLPPSRDPAPDSCYNACMTKEILTSREVEAERAVARAFLRRLPGGYDVAQAILFGSRARGDDRADSDLDLAVVLKGRRGDFIDTKLDMAGVAFDVLMETGVLVQPLPLWDDDLAHPERFANPALIRAIAAEGIRLG